MNINWFPGHMKKTADLIKQNLKLIDCVIELVDARIPQASRNPLFDDLLADKPRILALAKMDLADPVALQQWLNYYRANGLTALPIDATKGSGIAQLLQAVRSAAAARRGKLDKQGRRHTAIRTMIVGIPNVGKSTLINQLVGKRVAKTGNRPGVTRGKQWIRLNDDLELFDTPGILWQKIADDQTGLNLAYTGSIKDDILPIEEIALYFIRDVYPRYQKLFDDRYKLVDEATDEPLQIMEAIALKRGCILAGRQIDYQRVARLILDEFRKGIIGRISLEFPKEVS